MHLKDLVRDLADLIWQREQQSERTEESVLTYVHDAVVTELEYRRRVHELDRRLIELEGVPQAVAAKS